MTPLVAFDHLPRTRIVFGHGALVRLGELACEFGNRVLVVTDAGIVKAGHAARALDSLRAAGVEASLFDRVHENPTTRNVDDCVAAAREFRAGVMIGLGGGSSMDTAKGCNF